MLFRQKASVAALVDAFNAHDRSAAEGLLASDVRFVDRDGVELVGREDTLALLDQMFASPRGFRYRLDRITRRAGADLATLTVFHSLAPEGERLLWRVRYKLRKIAFLEAFRDGAMEGMASLFPSARADERPRTLPLRAAG